MFNSVTFKTKIYGGGVLQQLRFVQNCRMDVASDECLKGTFQTLFNCCYSYSNNSPRDQRQLNQSQTALFIASTLFIDWSGLIYALWLLQVVTLVIESLL